MRNSISWWILLVGVILLVNQSVPCISNQDVCPPTVDIFISDVFITQEKTGRTFTVNAIFSEPMDKSRIPHVVFDPDAHSVLANEKSAWSVDGTSYKWSYNIEQIQAILGGVDITVYGGRDLAGNDQVSNTLTDCLDVYIPTAKDGTQATLRGIAEKLGIYWGTCIVPHRMHDSHYTRTITEQFNLLVPDDSMYMSVIQPMQGSWNFSNMDKAVEFGEKNSMRIRGHPLVWGRAYTIMKKQMTGWNPTPHWVHENKFSRKEMIKIMNEHIEAVLRRYQDRVDEWVPVNESASWEPEGGFTENVWKKKIGDEYVELAFRKAREIAPKKILILNEWGSDYLGQTNYGREDNIYNHVKNLVQRGVPIDAIGLEFHLTIPEEQWENELTVRKIVANFDRYGKLGLDVYVTELDVKIKEPVTKEKITRQAKIYAMVMEAVLLSDACKSISVWGYTDKYSWIPIWFPGYSYACLFDTQINPKPAFYSVMEVLGRYLK